MKSLHFIEHGKQKQNSHVQCCIKFNKHENQNSNPSLYKVYKQTSPDPSPQTFGCSSQPVLKNIRQQSTQLSRINPN